MGTLYVVGTPIGNLEDLTLRAARVLAEVSLIAAEDTRVTRRLLNHLGVRVPLLSYNAHNAVERLPKLMDALASGDVALVSDAGTPAVSDPGADLVARAAAAGFPVEVVPGVSALTAALSVSGFSADDFVFLGFLPRRSKDRRARLREFGGSPQTLAIFEAPHRLRASLVDLLAELGDRQVAVCRELTKLHEEVFHGLISQAIEHFQAPRGELVLVVRGSEPSAGKPGPSPAAIEEASTRLERLRESGVRSRDAVAQVAAAMELPRNTVYGLWVETGRRNRG